MDKLKLILTEIKELKELYLINIKEILTIKEASMYSSYSEDALYKMIQRRAIGAYKPAGKLFIEKKELEKFMRTGRIHSQKEMSDIAFNRNTNRKE